MCHGYTIDTLYKLSYTLSRRGPLTALLLILAAAVARAEPEPELGGFVEAEVNGETVIFPTLKTDIDADIRGDLATVTVRQTFANPAARAVHARYLFPLNKDAAVYEMVMRVGDETVRAEIQRIEQAQQTFDQAKREGKSAALLRQRRPNMFTQDIANLTPGLPIEVSLRYTQTVPKLDGDYQLVIPLLVGPRYQPQGAGEAPQGLTGVTSDEETTTRTTGLGLWQLQSLPEYPPVNGLHLPGRIDAERVAVSIRLDAGMPIAGIDSPSHQIVISDADNTSIDETSDNPSAGQRETGRRRIALAAGRVIDNRDFVLRYRLAGETAQAGLLAYHDSRGGFFSLLLEPPAAPEDEAITPREMVFVLDASGSMHGLPMEASKTFMRRALAALRPGDFFRIVRFSDAATEFSTRPLPATPANVRAGIRYTDALVGSGGTEMSSGIRQALEAPVPPGVLRLVSFLTDGYIGNEAEVLRLIAERIGDARLYAFGVGSGVNRYLLSEMGRVGRGFTRYMDTSEDPEAVAAELVERLQSPLLTDIRIDWGTMEPSGLHPGRLPDLFAGQSLRVQGRYARPGTHRIVIRGRSRGHAASLPLQIRLPAAGEADGGGEAVALVWARSAIKDAMHELITPPSLRRVAAGGAPVSDQDLQRRITRLGLEFSLATRWTAFVAVSEKVYNPDPENAELRPLPLPQAAGVSKHAYAKGKGGGFSGGSTPEPGAWLGLLLLSGLVLARGMRHYTRAARRPV